MGALRQNMGCYLANGARLGWLLLSEDQAVEIWREGWEGHQRQENASRLEGGEGFSGLVLELAESMDLGPMR